MFSSFLARVIGNNLFAVTCSLIHTKRWCETSSRGSASKAQSCNNAKLFFCFWNREGCARSCCLDLRCCCRPDSLHILGGQKRLWLQLPWAVLVCSSSCPDDILSHPGYFLILDLLMHSFQWVSAFLGVTFRTAKKKLLKPNDLLTNKELKWYSESQLQCFSLKCCMIEIYLRGWSCFFV